MIDKSANKKRRAKEKKKVEELEHLEIIYNNSIRKNNSEVYKLQIINSDITIKTQDSAYSLEDRIEFKIHISELLEINFNQIKDE